MVTVLWCPFFFFFHFHLLSVISLAQEFRSHLLLSGRRIVTALSLVMDSLGCVGLLTWMVSLLFHISPTCCCIWFCSLYNCLIFHMLCVHTEIIKSRRRRIFGNSKLWILHASEADDFFSDKTQYPHSTETNWWLQGSEGFIILQLRMVGVESQVQVSVLTQGQCLVLQPLLFLKTEHSNVGILTSLGEACFVVKTWRLLSGWLNPTGAQICRHNLMKRKRQRRS